MFSTECAESVDIFARFCELLLLLLLLLLRLAGFLAPGRGSGASRFFFVV
jgi:hypothetical protein